jgi:hypothetical protein
MNTWAKPELDPEIVALCRNRTMSYEKLSKLAKYPSVYLFKIDYAEHLKTERVKIRQKREPKTVPAVEPVTVSAPVEPVRPLPEPKPFQGVDQNVSAAIIRVAGYALGVVGLALNCYYNFSLGQSLIASSIQAGICGVIDLLAVFLASAFFMMWEKRHYFSSFCCAIIWVVCFLFSLNTGVNFSATSIADNRQIRGDVGKKRAALNAAIEAKGRERDEVLRSRTAQAIEIEIQKAEEAVPALNWKMSGKCTDLTISLTLCANVRALRTEKDAAISSAEKRAKLDKIDTEIKEAEDKIAALPSISVEDPGSDQMNRLTFGLVNQARIETFRTIVMASMPSLAGFLLAFARTLGR